MSTESRMILLELNELTPALMDRFIAEGHLPHFRRFRDQAQTFITDAEERAPYLEPWIQWVTVHSGLTREDHGLLHLDEGHKLETKRVWDVLSGAGYRSWICGSMNVRYEADFQGGVLPDPWCTNVPAQPDELGVFFKFVQQNVLEYSNSRLPLTSADYIRFAAFMATHGLSFATVMSFIKQFSVERHGQNRWRRASLLDQLQFDVFRSYYRTLKPHFSTFFLNSTAHYQHAYWRTMEPELFLVKATPEQQEEYASAILFGYQQMDRIVGRFLALAGQDVTLVLCTALGQQPCLKYEEQGGASFYRPTEFDAIARFAGLDSHYKVAPVMTHQFHLEFASEAEAIAAEQQLLLLNIDGYQALSVERTGSRVFTGCQIYKPIADTAVLSLDSSRSIPFFDLFYKLDAMKSGMHHPDGLFWIRTPSRTHSTSKTPVPLSAVAPTILRLFGLQQPPYMRQDPVLVQP